MNPPAVIGQVLGLLEDHGKLADLEFQYEIDAGRRRLVALAFAALCFASALAFIQIVLIDALVHAGVPFYAACLGFAGLWGTLSVVIYKYVGRRDARSGVPFKGSREEFRRSLQWTQNLFS